MRTNKENDDLAIARATGVLTTKNQEGHSPTGYIWRVAIAIPTIYALLVILLLAESPNPWPM